MNNQVENTVNDFFQNKDFRVYLLQGIPGSGKSTWVERNHPDLPVVSRDIIRLQLGIAQEGEKVAGTKQQEREVTKVEYEQIEKYCQDKQSFIIDDMNISPYRVKMLELIRKYNPEIIGVQVKTPLDICIKRRNEQIPEKVMRRIYNSVIPFEENEVDKIIKVDGTK